jgi:hypothetical protein
MRTVRENILPYRFGDIQITVADIFHQFAHIQQADGFLTGQSS